MKATNRKAAADIPCYATYGGGDYSQEWANKLIDIWIAAKKAFVAAPVPVEEFRNGLRRAVLVAANFYEAFEESCREVRIAPNEHLYQDYEALHLPDALQLIPAHMHAEFCWVPEWDGNDLDDLIYEFGLKSDRWNSNYIENAQPGQWLTRFLKLVNCSSTDLIGEALNQNRATGTAFAEKCAKANFKVDKDQMRVSLLSPYQVIAAIENAYTQAIPMVHCEINLRALFEMDPTKAMRISSAKGKVHLGLHAFFNGAGYMDTYPGEVIVPADAIGFAGENRWSYGINKTYGIVKSCFYCTPEAINA